MVGCNFSRKEEGVLNYTNKTVSRFRGKKAIQNYKIIEIKKIIGGQKYFYND